MHYRSPLYRLLADLLLIWLVVSGIVQARCVVRTEIIISIQLLWWWLHSSQWSSAGIISREDSEKLLEGKPVNSFLVRVSEKIWGYAISYKAEDRCKHYLVDTSESGYQFFGTNQLEHQSLSQLVNYHQVRCQFFNLLITATELIILILFRHTLIHT